ncbi:MAG: baseplate J/gp47 family protein [Lachnospiraceae bacterium]|nr:baseplate J/gp47 family protein [Lachnospiraceae bacterium]
MLSIRSLDDRTYEELIQEALGNIPLYTKEWTNFNPSDPGITILENLTAFEILQQNHIDEITPAIRKKLLQLAGFQEERGRCARILIGAENIEETLYLPANQKFTLGDLCFETNKAIVLNPWEITRIFSICRGERKEFSYLTEREVNIPSYIFGEEPGEGDCIYFVTNGLPGEGEEIIFHITVADRKARNAFSDKSKNLFATLKWECLTEEGYQEMQVKDQTGCFLVSGDLRMRMPGTPVFCSEEGIEGYVIRATLERAEYDCKPKVLCVEGFLFEAWQRETVSYCQTLQKAAGGVIQSELVENGYILVFGKEEKGASYRKYEAAMSEAGEGRFYDFEIVGKDKLAISFQRKKYGYAPDKLKAPVKVLLYNEEIMRKYELGRVKGFDGQKIELPVSNIVPETFTIMAVREREDGELIYDFVRPGYTQKGSLIYHLYEKEGVIEIEDAGRFIGARLYMASCSITAGPEGNIRKGNLLKAKGISSHIRFYNRQEGRGGRFRESLTEVEERFFRDLYHIYTAVTASDYEELVKQTPELCIHKVKAFMKEDRNIVKLVVKPWTEERFPILSDNYKKAIYEYLEDKRLLTTKLIIQGPQYVPVDVHGTIYVGSQYKNAKAEIEKVITEYIDTVSSERNFGDILKFDRLYAAVQELECVEFIYDLHMVPQKSGLARLQEEDVIPEEECLCYAGNFYLQIGTYGK